jgi:hypothetical protein
VSGLQRNFCRRGDGILKTGDQPSSARASSRPRTSKILMTRRRICTFLRHAVLRKKLRLPFLKRKLEEYERIKSEIKQLRQKVRDLGFHLMAKKKISMPRKFLL